MSLKTFLSVLEQNLLLTKKMRENYVARTFNKDVRDVAATRRTGTIPKDIMALSGWKIFQVLRFEG